MFAYRKLTGIAFFGLLAFALQAQADSAQTAPLSLRPIEAGSFTLGTNHLVAFYTQQEGMCAVTAVVEERIDDEPSASPARFRFELAPGSRAIIDNAEGRTVALECGTDAEMLRIERQDVTAGLPEQAKS
jgi:hypothetical protein